MRRAWNTVRDPKPPQVAPKLPDHECPGQVRQDQREAILEAAARGPYSELVKSPKVSATQEMTDEEAFEFYSNPENLQPGKNARAYKLPT